MPNLNVITTGIAVLALIIASHWVRSWIEEPEVKKAPPDTVTLERQITKRDTVTETVAETVIRYDTIHTTDTAHVPVPMDYDLHGTIQAQPIDISGRDVTLTFYSPSQHRFIQNRYTVERPDWQIDVEGTVLAAPDIALGTSTLGLAHRTPVGWLRLGGGYGVRATNAVRTGWIGHISIRKRLHSWGD